MNNRIIILISLFFLTACDSDMPTISFPPKLAVTATLDGGSGIFTLLLSQGNSLADYAEPRSENREIIRNGEIRLFEDDKLIFSEPGPFDLSFVDSYLIFDENGQSTRVEGKVGFRFEKSDISTRPGSVYRLEIEVDGFKTVTASMTMPSPPVVTASMNTTVQERITFAHRGSYLGYEIWDIILPIYIWNEMDFWPVSVHITDPNPNERNYFVLEIQRKQSGFSEFINYKLDYTASSIGVSNLSILQDNPNIEASEGGLKETDQAAFYQFWPLPLYMSDITFPGKSASLTFYSEVERKNSYPDYVVDDPEYVKVLMHHTTTLHVRHIPTETFKYYRGQLLQRVGVGFYTEPVVIAGNIKNGYGFFSVYNSTSFQFLEYETEEYRKKQ